MGIDGIGPRVLKFCALPLSQPLCHLFFLSLKHHDLPEEWQCHLVTPIFKSGDKSSVKNYRPISFLCSVSKVLERLVYNKIIGTIRDRLTNCQYGFLEGRSSLHQLIIFLNQINNALDNIGQVDALYLDFRKAFDSVPHNELLCKLWKIGICGDFWMWFKCYLSSRRQCVHINSRRSPFLPVLSGVPQGSILGPFLFLIYIDDLPSVVSSSLVLLFADDTKGFKTIHDQSDAQSLQFDLNALGSWSNKWSVAFNESKCAIVHFHTKSESIDYQYYLNDQAISKATMYRDLGVFVSDTLS